MTVPFDVAARLAQGQPAVQDIQTYVSACQLRGYQNPDLTAHGAQVSQWYGTEDGLDLGALDADCTALGATAKALAEALRLARAQVAELSQAWTGPGATAAADFLRRHCDSAAGLVEAVAKAAESATILRDELWRIVDHKVEVTSAIEDRTQGQRDSWLAAARAVLAGDSTAQDSAQLLDAQVKPFVDNEIAGQWIPEMRATVAAARDAYRVALDDLVARPGVRFDIPGDLGPTCEGPRPRGSAPALPPAPPQAAVTPMGAAPPSAPPNTLDPTTSAAPAPIPPMPPAEATLPASPTATAPSGAMPGLGSAGEIPARLTDALGGLLSPSAGPQSDSLADLSTPPEVDIPTADESPVDEDEDRVDEAGVEDDEAEGPDAEDDVERNPNNDADAQAPAAAEDAEPEGDCPTESAEDPAAPPAAPAPPPAPAPSSADGATPCEIAADELPQAGQ